MPPGELQGEIQELGRRNHFVDQEAPEENTVLELGDLATLEQGQLSRAGPWCRPSLEASIRQELCEAPLQLLVEHTRDG